MNFPGHQPKLTVVPERKLDVYHVLFHNETDSYIEANHVEWGDWNVRFYNDIGPTERVLVSAFHASLIDQIVEVVDNPPEAA